MLCPYCQNAIDPSFFFCPNCGKKLREKPISTGIMAQVGVYALSLFLPPLNLPWTIRYLKSPGQGKIIGVVSLILMIVSLGAAIWAYKIFVTNLKTQLDATMKQYQYIGL